MSRIAMPSSASKQGFAFEHLILSHFQKSGRYQVREWSSYLHGKSGKWYQCDGIIENGSQRWLVEAKFFKDRLATVRDVRPREREKAARDMDCDGILYVSLSDFDHSMRSWSHDRSLTVQFVTWDDIRRDVLSGIEAHASVLLDEFKIKGPAVTSLVTDSLLRFNSLSPTSLAPAFPEFVTFVDYAVGAGCGHVFAPGREGGGVVGDCTSDPGRRQRQVLGVSSLLSRGGRSWGRVQGF